MSAYDVVELSVPVKARVLLPSEAKPRDLLSWFALSSGPYVVMPDGTVYTMEASEDKFALFTDTVARAYAANNGGLFIPSERDNPEFLLKDFIECARRVWKKFSSAMGARIDRCPGFLSDLEAELGYLKWPVWPVTQESNGRKERIHYHTATGLAGKIVEECVVPKTEAHSGMLLRMKDEGALIQRVKTYGPKENRYTIDLELDLTFFGEFHSGVFARKLTAQLTGAGGDGINEMKHLVNEKFCPPNIFQRPTGCAARISMEYEKGIVTLTMNSPEPILHIISNNGERPCLPPMSTADMLYHFVPVADKVAGALYALRTQKEEEKASIDGRVKLALGVL